MLVHCVGDLHGETPPMPGGDILIVAGDLTTCDKEVQYDEFWRWACYQPYEKVIVIAGNHDTFLERNPDFFKDTGDQIIYLCDSGVEINGIKFWGSPWTLAFPGINPKCKAFTDFEEKGFDPQFSKIPEGIDVLITHGPMIGFLDFNDRGHNCGSSVLRTHIDRVKPKYHIFGHIHEQGGSIVSYYQRDKANSKTVCINCSLMDENYDVHPERMIGFEL